MIPGAVLWCELCQSRPSNGILTILRDGYDEPEDLNVCTICVIELEDDDWA